MTVTAVVNALVLCLSTLAVDARITNAKIRNDDRPGILLSESFGFGGQGVLTLRLSNVHVLHGPPPDRVISWKSFRFYLSHRGDEIADYPGFTDRSPPRCPLPNYTMGQDELFTFAEPPIQQMITSHQDSTYKYPVDATNLGNGGKDALFFVNCESNKYVSFDIQVEMFNEVNGRKSYLSVGELELPAMYLVRPLFICTGCTTDDHL